MHQSYISGMGHFVPDNVVTNNDLTQFMDTSDEWIRERTGIEERRFVNDENETTATMGAKAARNAIKNAKIDKKEIDFIIFATLSPDYYFPGPGVQVQDLLELPTIGALDVRNQCSGFLYALSVADQFVKTGMYKNILVIGSEVHSRGLEMSTSGRGVSIIFGDGAGAAVVSRSENNERGILSTHLHSEGKHAEQLTLTAPGMGKRWVSDILKDANTKDRSYFPFMNGNFVFKHAVVRFAEVINEALNQNGYSSDEIDVLVPHQANLRISQFVQKQFGLRNDQVFNNIMKYGNTTAASIPIALSEALEEGKIKEGNLVCLAAFGSGFTWASALIKWCDSI